jgi:AhpD family alkylhydroperoxidase
VKRSRSSDRLGLPTDPRRGYASSRELLRDVAALLRRAPAVARLLGPGRLDPAFRERLMLVVTGVNDCRYCAWFHSRLGEAAGITNGEVRALLGGSMDSAPDHELPALLLATEWAERNAPDGVDLRSRLAPHYGVRDAATIDATLRLIRTGNLVGNTFDRLLCRASGGRVGCGRGARSLHLPVRQM